MSARINRSLILISAALLPMGKALAWSETDPNPISDTQCQSQNEQSPQVQDNQNASRNNDCKDKSSSSSVKSEEEKKLEEERLKVLFVDVNTVMEKVGSTMDWTANWLDGYFAETDESKDKAKAWGHVIMGWEPKDGEWSNFPVKFKVRAKLPNLKNRVELILSDNEQDDFTTLPYETVRPEAYKSSQRSLGAAIRFLHSSSENVKSATRLGWGDNQLYLRSSLTYRKKYFDDKVTFLTQPALEYYVKDGWGARLLFDTAYKFNESQEMRLSYAIRDLESFESPEWRTGLFHFTAFDEKSALIVGASSVGITEPEYRPSFHKFSIRYRRKAIRSWIFIEAEPFVQFSRDWITDDSTMMPYFSDFERDVGIAFRLEAHYGFL